jgi:hypothetical protein
MFMKYLIGDSSCSLSLFPSLLLSPPPSFFSRSLNEKEKCIKENCLMVQDLRFSYDCKQVAAGTSKPTHKTRQEWNEYPEKPIVVKRPTRPHAHIKTRPRIAVSEIKNTHQPPSSHLLLSRSLNVAGLGGTSGPLTPSSPLGSM